jgi:hypothetical protein
MGTLEKLASDTQIETDGPHSLWDGRPAVIIRNFGEIRRSSPSFNPRNLSRKHVVKILEGEPEVHWVKVGLSELTLFETEYLIEFLELDGLIDVTRIPGVTKKEVKRLLGQEVFTIAEASERVPSIVFRMVQCVHTRCSKFEEQPIWESIAGAFKTKNEKIAWIVRRRRWTS